MLRGGRRAAPLPLAAAPAAASAGAPPAAAWPPRWRRRPRRAGLHAPHAPRRQRAVVSAPLAAAPRRAAGAAAAAAGSQPRCPRSTALARGHFASLRLRSGVRLDLGDPLEPRETDAAITLAAWVYLDGRDKSTEIKTIVSNKATGCDPSKGADGCESEREAGEGKQRSAARASRAPLAEKA